jgi:hypothetical protein
MNATINALALRFKELKEKSEEQSAILKKIDAEWSAVENDLMSEMALEGCSSVALEGIGKFSFSTKDYLSVTQEKKPGFIGYLKESGNGDLVKEDVNSATLSKFLSEHLDELSFKFEKEMGLGEHDARGRAREVLVARGCSIFEKKTLSFRKK